MLSTDGSVWKLSGTAMPTRVTGYTLDGKEMAIAKIAAGTDHVVAVDVEGNVWAVGGNAYGQLGDASNTTSTRPVRVRRGQQTNINSDELYLTNVTDVAAGNGISAAIDAEGELFAWGRGDSGALGNSTTSNAKIPVHAGENQSFLTVAAGDGFLLAVDTVGGVWSTGKNTVGQLGDGGIANKSHFVSVGGNEIYSYYNGKLVRGTLVLKAGETGTISHAYNMFNLYQEKMDTASYSHFVMDESSVVEMTQAGAVTAVKPGTTYLRTIETTYTRKEVYLRIVVIANTAKEKVEFQAQTRGSHTILLRHDGTLWAYGANLTGELGTGDTTPYDNPQKISKDGMTFVAIAAGYDHTLAVDSDGKVWAVGGNAHGQLGDGTTEDKLALTKIEGLENIIAVAAGDGYSLALDANGIVYGFGRNDLGQIGLGLNVPYKWTPTRLNLSRIAAISAGKEHALYLMSDGYAYATGNYLNGRLGTGTTDQNAYTPVEVIEASGIVAVSAGADHSMLLNVSGQVYTFGANTRGQLGLNSIEDAWAPKLITSQSDMRQISAGDEHSAFVNGRGYLYTFGKNNSGQLGLGTYEAVGIPTSNDSMISDGVVIMGVSAGSGYTIFNDINGLVQACGDYTDGAITVPVNCTKGNIPSQLGGALQFAAPHSIKLTVGASMNLSINAMSKVNLLVDDTDSNKLTFASANTAIASVAADGTVTGNAIGTTTISTTKNGVTSLFIVRVLSQGDEAVPMMASGNSHAIALKSDGSVWAWGENTYGQLGFGENDRNNSSVPRQITTFDGMDIVAVYAGEYHSAALTASGEVYMWGDNSKGQVGIDTLNVGASVGVPTLNFIAAIPEDATKVDIIVTPSSKVVQDIKIDGVADSTNASTGARSRFNYDVSNAGDVVVPISVTSFDGNIIESGYQLTIQKMQVNNNIKSVTADPGGNTENADITADYEMVDGTMVKSYFVYIHDTGVSPYSATLKVEAEDPTAMVSVRGSAYELTQNGVVVVNLSLINPTIDTNHDGKNDTFAVPVIVKSQAETYESYTIYVMLADLSATLESVLYDSLSVEYDKDTNTYTVFEDADADRSKDMLLSGSAKTGMELRDVTGNVLESSTNNNKAAVKAVYAGGIAAFNRSAGNISRVYNIGEITAANVGGIAYGSMDTARINYSFTGAPTSVVNSTVSNQLVHNSASRPYRVLKLQDTYTTWDFATVWEMEEGQTPTLRVMMEDDPDVSVDEPGSETNPYQISDAAGVQGIENDLSGHYILANDINLSGSFMPLGTAETPFTGSLNGNGKTINNLVITQSVAGEAGNEFAGIFAFNAGVIENLVVAVPNISISADESVGSTVFAGAIAGHNSGTIKNSVVRGGTVAAYHYAGAIAGYNTGTISDSYSTSAVSVSDSMGGSAGIAAYNIGGTVERTYYALTGTAPNAGIVFYNDTADAVKASFARNNCAKIVAQGEKADDSCALLSKLGLTESTNYTDAGWNDTETWLFRTDKMPTLRMESSSVSTLALFASTDSFTSFSSTASSDSCEHILYIDSSKVSARVYIKAQDNGALLAIDGVGAYRGEFDGVFYGLTNKEHRYVVTVTATDGSTEDHTLVIRKLNHEAGIGNLAVNGLEIKQQNNTYDVEIADLSATSAYLNRQRNFCNPISTEPWNSPRPFRLRRERRY